MAYSVGSLIDEVLFLCFIFFPSAVIQVQGRTKPRSKPVSSVGRVPDYRAGGRGFKLQPEHHSGSLNNRGESAAFVMSSANGQTF